MIGAIKQLWRLLWRMDKRDHLPRLSRDLHDEYNPEHIDTLEIELVLGLGVAPDVKSAKDLLEKYNVTTAAELEPLLPKKQRRFGARLWRYIGYLDGSYETNPYNRQRLEWLRRDERLPRGSGGIPSHDAPGMEPRTHGRGKALTAGRKGKATRQLQPQDVHSRGGRTVHPAGEYYHRDRRQRWRKVRDQFSK